MEVKQLVEEYFDAWNRRDLDALLELLHPGAAYYDSFWMETCVGRNLAEYIGDTMAEMPHWYRIVGELIETESGVVSRYSAHDSPETRSSEPLYFGAEVLVLLDGRILTVTDLYCDPHPDALREVAAVVATRHGVTAHTRQGLSNLRTMRIRERLLSCLSNNKDFLEPNLTLAELAERVDCSADQLSLVIHEEFGTTFEELLARHRKEYADNQTDEDSEGLGYH